MCVRERERPRQTDKHTHTNIDTQTNGTNLSLVFGEEEVFPGNVVLASIKEMPGAWKLVQMILFRHCVL